MIIKSLQYITERFVKLFHRPPSVGEFITCLGGLGFILFALLGNDTSIPKSISQLASFGKSPTFWYVLGLLGLTCQMIGLLCNYKWIRWVGAIFVASWWLNLAIALVSISGATPFLPLYLCLVVLNAYVVAHLLWKE